MYRFIDMYGSVFRIIIYYYRVNHSYKLSFDLKNHRYYTFIILFIINVILIRKFLKIEMIY